MLEAEDGSRFRCKGVHIYIERERYRVGLGLVA